MVTLSKHIIDEIPFKLCASSMILRKYAQVTREIHLHGVKGNDEHQALSIVPLHRVKGWGKYLDSIRYSGVVNLEVFTLDDLEASVGILCNILS